MHTHQYASQLIRHHQSIDRIEIVFRQNLQHRITMLLVKAQRSLVIDRDFQYHMIAAGLLQVLLPPRQQTCTRSVVLVLGNNVDRDDAAHKTRGSSWAQTVCNDKPLNDSATCSFLLGPDGPSRRHTEVVR